MSLVVTIASSQRQARRRSTTGCHCQLFSWLCQVQSARLPHVSNRLINQNPICDTVRWYRWDSWRTRPPRAADGSGCIRR